MPKWVVVLFFIIINHNNLIVATFHNPFICCHQKNDTTLPLKKAWSLTHAVLHMPKQCNHTNVALAVFNTTKGYKQVSCLNGFGLMSFCLALFDRLTETRVWVVDRKFYDELLSYKVQFAAQFSKSTTDSSQFKNNLNWNIIVRNGEMAEETHVVGSTGSSDSYQQR
ncbi:orf47 [Alcelaphine gammaherpesvirus 2]|uniref:Orf47 n=1 Tax=Alcelaphine gammaherpesvirus 2 TaxID=138184 RepID=A0A068ABR9_9GAMA|nr:orf47 [Alcelaphine gammaherpesvirus 2]AIA62083.1 orf47 [Alcelaphine gammaherpesvirus 2]